MKRASLILTAIILLVSFAFSQLRQPVEIQTASKLLGEKKYKEAAVSLTQFLNSKPKSARGWYLLASARHKQSDFKGAVDALKKNLAINKNWRGMYNLAAAYSRLGERQLAFEWLEKALNNGAAFAVNIDSDEDFADIRNDARYKRMIEIIDKRKNPCMYSEKARQFDFWIGDWDVFVNGRKVGENLIERETNGCTLIENWKNNSGGTGKSINAYDASVGKWKQFYVGSQGSLFLFEGGLVGNQMKFTAETVDQKGSKTLHRFEFTDLPDKTVRQKWDTSKDGGKTYTTIWDSIYKKKKPGNEVSFDSTDGVTLYGDVYESSKGKSAPLVMLFHQGGGDVRGEYASHIPKLLKKGYNVIAVDLRTGGDRFGSVNRTVANLKNKKYGYCDAYPDLAATLNFARKSGFTGKTVAWGSSFSAALVFQLAAKYQDEIAGILAFSPASGGPMEQCKPDLYSKDVRAKVFAARPRREINENSEAQLKSFRDLGFETYVSENGVHGSSMLNAERVKGDVSDHWRAVFNFMNKTLNN
jgi:pimeloyl-ACP methyl ester carboxylesterase